MLSGSTAKEQFREDFPNISHLAPGEWSEKGLFIPLKNGDVIEIGIYREPADSDYAGTYTLQIFRNDDVVLCDEIDC